MDWDEEESETAVAVTLQWYEVAVAAQIGAARRIEAMRQAKQSAHGYDDTDAWTVDIEGAAAEMAFCKALGIYFDCSVNTFKAPDAAGRWQVRHSVRGNARLIVRPGDADEDSFVLVTGRAPYFTVVGWIKGKAAKRIWLLDAPAGRPPAYFVSHHLLQPLNLASQTTSDKAPQS